MKILLDTAAMERITAGSSQLSARAAEIFADPANDIAVSPITIWEPLVKNQISKLPTETPLPELIDMVRDPRFMRSLPVLESAVLRLPSLPALHREPFDRLLICQALDKDMTLLTPDEQIRAYPVPTVW